MRLRYKKNKFKIDLNEKTKKVYAAPCSLYTNG